MRSFRLYRQNLWRYLPRLPIKLQMTMAMVVVVGIAVAIVSLTLVNRQREELYQQSLRLGMTTLGYLVNSSVLPLIEDDVLLLNKMITEVGSVDGFVHGAIVDRRGRIRAHSDHTMIGKPLPLYHDVEASKQSGNIVYFNHSLEDGQYVLELQQKIGFQGKDLGTALVALSLKHIDSRIAANNKVVLAVGGFSLLLGAFTALLLGIGFSRPIESLVTATREFGRGNFKHRVEMDRNDELGDLAVAFNYMGQELEDKVFIETSFGRYVSPEVVTLIRENPEGALIKGQRLPASVLFADVRDFTRYSEDHPPEVVLEQLNEYFEIATDCVLSRGGHIDKFIGDAVLAVFGAPLRRADHAAQAVMTAVEIQKKLHEAAKKSSNPLLTRVGISIETGDVVAGNIGSKAKLEYTVIGDRVNVASRLNNLALAGEIKITSDTYQEAERFLGAMLHAEHLPAVTVKGKSKPIDIYRVLGVNKGVGTLLS